MLYMRKIMFYVFFCQVSSHLFCCKMDKISFSFNLIYFEFKVLSDSPKKTNYIIRHNLEIYKIQYFNF